MLKNASKGISFALQWSIDLKCIKQLIDIKILYCTVYVLYNITSGVQYTCMQVLSHALTWFDLMVPMYKKHLSRS